MSIRLATLESLINKSCTSGNNVTIRMFCMASPPGLRLTLRGELTPESVVTVYMVEHDSFLSTKASPSENERESLRKAAMLLDSYLAFCYGDLYRVEDEWISSDKVKKT